VKTLILSAALAIVTTLSACAVDLGPSSSTDDTSSTAQDIVTPATVCGLPQRCTPWSCTIGADGGATCYAGPGQTDFECQLACGTLEAFCPAFYPDCRACDVLSGSAFQYCWAQCMEAFTTSCQTGRDDL
jgi:hypothetical protein